MASFSIDNLLAKREKQMVLQREEAKIVPNVTSEEIQSDHPTVLVHALGNNTCQNADVPIAPQNNGNAIQQQLHIANGGESIGEPAASKTPRSVFTADQLKGLESEFIRDPTLKRQRRIEIAAALNLNEIQVLSWFQNRRTKSRRLLRQQTYQNGGL